MNPTMAKVEEEAVSGGLSDERLRELFREMLLIHPRFQIRIVEDLDFRYFV